MAYTTVLLLPAMRVFIAVPSVYTESTPIAAMWKSIKYTAASYVCYQPQQNHVSTAWRLKIGCADAMGMSEDSCRKVQQLKAQSHLCSCSSSMYQNLIATHKRASIFTNRAFGSQSMDLVFSLHLGTVHKQLCGLW
eukprot:16313-Heterococcus_DN1.PRE.3